MKLFSFLFILFSFSSFSFSQEKSIKIITTKNEKGIVYSVINFTSISQQVTLKVTTTNLRGNINKVTKTVNPNDTLILKKLYFIKNKKWTQSYNYTYQPKPTIEENLTYQEKLSDKFTMKFHDMNQGIVVFSKDGCPRCHFTTNYLLDNNIDFKYLDTTNNEEANQLMWKVLKEKNINEEIIMPVIIVNGKIAYNIDDLEDYVIALKH